MQCNCTALDVLESGSKGDAKVVGVSAAGNKKRQRVPVYDPEGSGWLPAIKHAQKVWGRGRCSCDVS